MKKSLKSTETDSTGETYILQEPNTQPGKFKHSVNISTESISAVTESKPIWVRGKESTCNEGDKGLSGSGRSSRVGNGNPL